jgi:anthranilate/para-aminobenzoate synthase component I
VWLTRLLDCPSDLGVARRLARVPGLAWLDGGLEHGREGRFSFISTAPCCVISEQEDARDPWRTIARLAENLAPSRMLVPEASLTTEDIPRWVGHVTYDAGLGDLPRRPAPAQGVPAVRFARHDAWVMFDHAHAHAYLVGDDRAACERLRTLLDAPPLGDEALAFSAGPVEVTPRAQHAAAIRAALGLIREGEVYEINLARRFRARFDGSALGLFLRMRTASPVPLGYFVDGGDHAVLGRSMERFFRFRASDRALWTAPIKGTVARRGDDAAEAAALQADPKEHAEHAMVVDLMRNDLSRVCEIGSVEVAALMEVVPFAGLSHLISTVRGRARSDVDLGTLFKHTFPPGSVTGTPKLRVLSAIEALEDVPRGVYTGCYGFIDHAGGSSWSVAIRTAVVAHGSATYFAGGGIVADSDPEREVAETELKAALFLRALGTEG